MHLTLVAADSNAGHTTGFIFGIVLWGGLIVWVMRRRRGRSSRKLSKSFEQTQAPTFQGSRPASLGQRGPVPTDEP